MNLDHERCVTKKIQIKKHNNNYINKLLLSSVMQPKLTIFTIPKAFKGHINIIQRNAIQSWKKLGVPVVLCGNDPGVKKAAEEFDCQHIPNIKTNDFNTPYLNDAFEKVTEIAETPLLCYTNSDIILLSSLLAAINKVNFKDFFISGRRWNVNITKPLNFEDINWEQDLYQYTRKNSKPFVEMAMDYFIFPKNSAVNNLPPFVVGRPTWDTWFLFNAWNKHIPTIDITEATTVMHQNHDYGHVAGYRPGTFSDGPEADVHKTLSKGNQLDLLAVDYLLTEAQKLVPNTRQGAALLHYMWRIFPDNSPKNKRRALSKFITAYLHHPILYSGLVLGALKKKINPPVSASPLG